MRSNIGVNIGNTKLVIKVKQFLCLRSTLTEDNFCTAKTIYIFSPKYLPFFKILSY